MTKLIVSECKGIFPFQKDSAGSLRRSIEMFVDTTVYIDSDGGSSSNYSNVVGTAILFSYLAAKKEDEYNISKFGEKYKEYMKKVPMVIPRIRKN